MHDQQGSTRLLVNSSGAVQASYTYDAYGNVIGKTGTVPNPFGYDGQFTDAESGLIYLRARYYDLATAQFLNRDPLGMKGGTNLYSYAQSDPLNLIDPTGLDVDPFSELPASYVQHEAAIEEGAYTAAKDFFLTWSAAAVLATGAGAGVAACESGAAAAAATAAKEATEQAGLFCLNHPLACEVGAEASKKGLEAATGEKAPPEPCDGVVSCLLQGLELLEPWLERLPHAEPLPNPPGAPVPQPLPGPLPNATPTPF